MTKKDRVYMPSGAGGLVRFGDEPNHKFKLKPEWVLYMVGVVVVLEVLLKFFMPIAAV
jgi:preprotein translocase subunit Sec61beta